MKIVKPSVQLLWITPDPMKQIELAGRTCYKSEDRITPTSSEDFCRRMRKSGHHAMLEHACASFRIVTDRGITHEIVRHRLASYAQESTRYCNYSKDKFGSECSFIEPPGLGDHETSIAFAAWADGCIDAEIAYFKLVEGGQSPQIARSVLPNCTKTEIVMTANLREFRHFITLRGSAAAHPQIRPIALAMWIDLMQYAPAIFEDLTPEGFDKPNCDNNYLAI